MDGPGIGYALERLGGMVSGWASITPPPSGVRFDRDAEVPMRDGTVLRVNVFRPEGDAKVPAIVSAHPYGKDALPKKGLFGYTAVLHCGGARDAHLLVPVIPTSGGSGPGQPRVER